MHAPSNRPNILMIMADQLPPFALGAYGNPAVESPNIDALAQAGVRFDSAYCNSPLCAPARFSLLSGRLPSAIGAYDNAAYFPANVPTVAHYLRGRGYRTCLSGKMHFVGPDQLHGFEERRTTDIYPADFGWTPWYHDMSSVTDAGVAAITNQLEFDDEVGAAGVQALYDFARGADERPFFLCVSFTHPHDPYVTRQRYWDLYRDEDIDMPSVPPVPVANLDPHSRRLRFVSAMPETTISDRDIRNARRAFYGNVSYVDEWVGRLVETLQAIGVRETTAVIFLSDHGDMLGERGLWYKMSFFEWSARIPLIVSAPGCGKARCVANTVSHVDVLPTLLDMAGGFEAEALPAKPDGRSLLPLLENAALASLDPDEAVGEYMGEGAIAPIVMIRRGTWKYIHCKADPPQLYDLSLDPSERQNLAGRQETAETESDFATEIERRWDLDRLNVDVLADQRTRRFLHAALMRGQVTSWDHQPVRDASRRFMRNYLDLHEVERKARFPRA
jgi:choline-sulfatase